MFNNIGRKIKLCAELVTWIGIIISILTGIILMITDGTFNGFFIGLLYCIIGPLACWVSAFVLYGFGQLIENSDILVKALAPEQNKSTNVNIKQISIVESERIKHQHSDSDWTSSIKNLTDEELEERMNSEDWQYEYKVLCKNELQSRK